MSNTDSGIVRVEHNKDHTYVVLSKELTEDARLSYGARGMMAYLLSKPDTWHVRMTDLESKSRDGRQRVRSLMHELEEAGYIRRSQVRDKAARWQTVTTVYEEPQPINGKPLAESRGREPVNGNAVDILSNEPVSTHVISEDANASSLAERPGRVALPAQKPPAKRANWRTEIVSEAQAYWWEQFGRAKWATKEQRRRFLEVEQKVGTAILKDAIRWAAQTGVPNIQAIYTAAEKMWKRTADGRASPIAPPPRQTREVRVVYSDGGTETMEIPI